MSDSTQSAEFTSLEIPDEEATLARSAGAALDPAVSQKSLVELAMTSADGTTRRVSLPPTVARVIQKVLSGLGEGDGIAVVPKKKEVDIDQASEILNLSREFVAKLLDQGELPCRMVQSRRLIPLVPLLDYKRESDAARRSALSELVAESQAMGLE